jgi:hypothetical protein
MARVVVLIWVCRKQKYFYKAGWTAKSLICPSGATVQRLGSVERSDTHPLQSLDGDGFREGLNPFYVLSAILRLMLNFVARSFRRTTKTAWRLGWSGGLRPFGSNPPYELKSRRAVNGQETNSDASR